MPLPPQEPTPPHHPDKSPGLIVAFDCAHDDADDEAWLTQKLQHVCRELGLRHVELNVVVIGDDAMAEMHQQFLNVPGTTDVITFDLRDNADRRADAIDGEIYVCIDEARRRAEALGHPVRHELLLYGVHGILHLLGYDDHDPAQHQIMHAKEDELLMRIGVGAVFESHRSQATDEQ